MNDPDTIRKAVEGALARAAGAFDMPPFAALPAAYREALRAFVLRRGKRLRPVLFVLAYEGYAAGPMPDLYRAAAALEILHDFILVHDDIIDRAARRRGAPSLPARFRALLDGRPDAETRARNLALVAGDALYVLGVRLFAGVDADPARRQRALERLTDAALHTACGELEELFCGLRPAGDVTEASLARVGEGKTAHYSFALPMTAGAVLGGADEDEIGRLDACGRAAGRAFQIRDDALDVAGNGDGAGKPVLQDLREGTLTVPVRLAWARCGAADRAHLAAVLHGGAGEAALAEARRIILASGAVDAARARVAAGAQEARALLEGTRMRQEARRAIGRFLDRLLAWPQGAGGGRAPTVPGPG
ncbi:MAG: polyprenyl synthetase family protein [Lentisphaerae bacterium]|nr:polyprenyl synthetase family protein [Lentisphaerota bacterium]